jgi:hypothetical protein
VPRLSFLIIVADAEIQGFARKSADFRFRDNDEVGRALTNIYGNLFDLFV